MGPESPLSIGEITLIVLALVAWISAIVLFLYKWGKIRISHPTEPRFKHKPKNLDSIKVVDRPSDGVIYKSYSNQISKTMQAREEKRLQRMSTMPELRAIIPEETKKVPTLSKICTSPILEMDRTQSSDLALNKQSGLELQTLHPPVQELEKGHSDSELAKTPLGRI